MAIPTKIPFTQISVTSIDIVLAVYYLVQAFSFISLILATIYLLIFNQAASYIYYPMYDKIKNLEQEDKKGKQDNVSKALLTSLSSHTTNEYATYVYGPNPLLKYNILLFTVYTLYFIVFGVLLIVCDYKQKKLLNNVEKCFINRNKYI